ncbi:RDD family protein [Peredibacter sp. HCB2-198]|uniref:RDD family protein n=1 Tax=Peredibacter sp. HCB2-198 TaxID=3383025 RepID=UPI0038B4A566
MNLESVQNKKNTPPANDDFMEEFDFKPITSGLGFHHQKATEVKPMFTERTVAVSPLPTSVPSMKKEMNVYQNDLSMFYNQAQTQEAPVEVEPVAEEKYYRVAGKTQRVFAYLTDLTFVAGLLAGVLTIMAKSVDMDLIQVWEQYPHEITPLVVTLFCGFYLIYFAIFEKASQSTLGKNLFNLRVTSMDNGSLSLTTLLMRSIVSLLNFASLGLFSYFDLQNKVTNSKVIRID